MKNKCFSVSLKNLMFFIGYIFLFVHNIIFSFSTLNVTYSFHFFMLFVAFSCFLIYSMIIRKFNLRNLVVIILVIILGLISYRYSGKMDLLYFSFLLFFSQFILNDSFIVFDLFTRIAVTLILFALSYFGVIQNMQYIKSISIGSTRFAYGCGFNNPNSFGIMVFCILVDCLLLLKDKKRKRDSVALFLIYIALSALVYKFSGTKTSLLLMFLLYVLFVLYNKKFFYLKLSKYSHFIILFFFVFGFITVIGYRASNPLILALNRIITGRIGLWDSFIRLYPVRLFGNYVTYIGSYQANQQMISAVICDNVYIYYLHNLGLIPCLFWGIIICKTFQYLLSKKMEAECLSFLVFCIYGLVENTIANVMFFPMVVFCSKCVFKNDF